MLVIKLILEGLGLGGLLCLLCAVGIHGGAIGMIHLYDKKVQERVISLGMTTEEAIRKRGSPFRNYVLASLNLSNICCQGGRR